MLDTYIKNRGTTKTIIHDNNHNHVNQINWDADYDGNVANISVDLNGNGKNSHYDFSFDNQDLANILSVPSVTSPLEKRLKKDFSNSYDPSIYKVELDTSRPKPDTLQKLLSSASHVSSPLPNEELIVPLTINEKTLDNYTFTPRRRHKRIKTHKTHKVYKKPKSSKGKSKRNSRIFL